MRAVIKTVWNTDASVIGHCLTGCSNEQRKLVQAHYLEKYRQKLAKELEKALTGCMEGLMLALLLDPFQFLSGELHNALHQKKVDKQVLVEILCTKTNDEISKINEAYRFGELELRSIR